MFLYYEQAAALHRQREERRKARLLQVRKQEKAFAKSVREEVKTKKEAERRAIQEHLDAALAASHDAELREIESRYLSRMGQIGKGHSDAQHINEVVYKSRKCVHMVMYFILWIFNHV